MFAQRCSDVVNVGPALNQHSFNVLYLLGRAAKPLQANKRWRVEGEPQAEPFIIKGNRGRWQALKCDSVSVRI